MRRRAAVLGANVGEVDEGLGASTRTLLGRRTVTLGNHPKPGVVVDDLNLLVVVELRLDLHGVVVALIPRAEVDENAPELLALLVGLGHHVHALDESKLERVEDGADALLADVLEDTRNADAVDDGLGGARRALLLGGRTRHFEVELWETVYVESVCEFKYFLTQKSISIFCKINSFLALLF